LTVADTFNFRIYGAVIQAWIPDIGTDDLQFMVNKAAALYQEIDDPCTDNFRVSRLPESAAYCEAVAGGCCGSVDQEWTNPLTGNSFVVGFNYGH
jgi:hypothetical protein